MIEFNSLATKCLQIICEFDAQVNALVMADRLSTMENVIVSANCVQLQSSTANGTHSGTSTSSPSSGQTDCTINSNHSHFDAENIVSSTQESTSETINEKLISERTLGTATVNKCVDETNAKLTLPTSMAIETHRDREESHIDKANTSSSQSQTVMDESKHRSHINESSSKIKSKPTDSG